MKIGIFAPYLDTIGGGERYIMTLAEYWSQKGYEVDIFWNNSKIKKVIEERLGINLDKIEFVEDIFSSKISLPQRWQITKKYDLIFYVSDGSIPFLFAKKNILHFQVPFKGVGGKSLLNRLKLIKFKHVVCNSNFTKKHIDQEYGIKSQVVYPPVAVEDFKPGKKENLILSVGRFVKTGQQKGLIRPLHSKKQNVLIEAFKKVCGQGSKGWQLILVGGVLKEDESHVDALKKLANGYPIKIKTNIKFAELKKYYGKAKIFWHAAGFGEDESQHPERVEHFGIAVVEAMAAGCAPVVVNKGGLPEIVKNGLNGLLWKTKADLVKNTLQLIAESQAVQPHSRLRSKVKSPNLWEKLSTQAIKDSQRFSKKVFCQKIDEMVKD